MVEPIKDKVTLTYKDDKVTIKGEKIHAVLDIASDQLSTMYWGGEGHAELTLTLNEPHKSK